MRGMIPATVCAEIERRAGKPLAQIFDLIGGTSTGGIIAALAAAGVSAKDAMAFYRDRGPVIFRRGLLRGLGTACGVAGPKYDGRILARELWNAVGCKKCHEAKTKIILPTVDADEIEAVFIKSWDNFWQDFPLWAAATATASAQTFFPSFSCDYQGKARRYLDGGNHSNNPLASVVFEALRLWPGEEIRVVHIGTGRESNPKPLPDGGLAAWAPLVFGTVSDCQDDLARYFTADLPRVRIESFDLNFSRNPDMDDASEKTLTLMHDATRQMIHRNSARLYAALEGAI